MKLVRLGLCVGQCIWIHGLVNGFGKIWILCWKCIWMHGFGKCMFWDMVCLVNGFGHRL